MDMAGNVWEWTSTQFRKYNYNPDDGREEPDAGDDVLRVLRGGSWFNDAWFVRSAVRLRNNPGIRNFSVGFRVVL